MITKRVELMRQLLPAADMFALLLNSHNPNAETRSRDVQRAARALGRRIYVLYASDENEIDVAFAKLAQQRIGGLLVQSDPFFTSQRDQLVALAAHHAVPTIYEQREYVAAGGLMSYGASQTDVYRQGGVYTARILKGEKPADLPVMQPTKFELVINLKAAKALGLNCRPQCSRLPTRLSNNHTFAVVCCICSRPELAWTGRAGSLSLRPHLSEVRK